MDIGNFALWYGVVTGSASVVGLIIAFVQLRSVANTAKTASDTSRRVESQLQQRSVLFELSTCGQAVSDARNYLRIGQVESALYRIEGLASRLSSISKLRWFDSDERKKALDQALYSVALVRTALDEQVCANAQELAVDDAQGFLRRLGKVEDQLNEWVGELRYSQEERQK